MKNKRLLVILLLFIFIGGAAVSTAVVFRVEKINIILLDKLDQEKYMSTSEISNVLADSKQKVKGVVRKKNLLFSVNDKKVRNAVETGDARIKVANILRKAPNTLNVEIHERYPMYYLIYGTRTAILDSSLQIVSHDEGLLVSFDLINITAQFEDLNDSFEDFKPGDNLCDFALTTVDKEHAKALVDMAKIFARSDLDGGYKEADLARLIQNIDFYAPATPDDNMTIVLRDPRPEAGSFHLNIEIRHFQTNFGAKIFMAWYCLQQETEYRQGYLIVGKYNEPENITAIFIPHGDGA